MSYLSKVRSGVIESNIKMIMYGTEGIGKSTFAADAPSPIFMCSEVGTEELNVSRAICEDWREVSGTVHELRMDDHAFKTLVIDTLDWLEPILHDQVCMENSWKAVEDVGYGKGYAAARVKWRKFLAALEALRSKMHIVLLAHSQVKKYSNPAGDDYDRHILQMNEKSAAIIKQWASAVLFAEQEMFVVEKDGKKKGVSNGRRVLRTEGTAVYDAKNRWNLPPTIELDWQNFWEAKKAGGQDVEKTALGLLESQSPEKQAKISAWIENQVNKKAAYRKVIEQLS